MTVHKRLTFWGAHQDDDSLVRDVIAGRKTVTADTVEAYYRGYGAAGEGGYQAGDVIDVHDLRGRLRCVIVATKVALVRFGAVPEAVWRGENLDSAEAFRQCHREALAPLVLDDDSELVTLHFALLAVTEVTEGNAGTDASANHRAAADQS